MIGSAFDLVAGASRSGDGGSRRHGAMFTDDCVVNVSTVSGVPLGLTTISIAQTQKDKTHRTRYRIKRTRDAEENRMGLARFPDTIYEFFLAKCFQLDNHTMPHHTIRISLRRCGNHSECEGKL